MADVPFRSAVKDLLNLKVANTNGQMVPLATLMNVRSDLGPVMMMRYNLYPAAAITGIPNIFESGSVLIDKVEQTARKQLPDNFSYEWSEIFYLQLIAGNTASVLLGLGVVLVFLVLEMA